MELSGAAPMACHMTRQFGKVAHKTLDRNGGPAGHPVPALTNLEHQSMPQ